MTGQIAGPSIFSLELVGLIVGASMVVGAIDLIRQPGWAWKRAEESKAAYLILVLLLPLVGLAMYLLAARPKVATIATAGRAASLPFERFGDDSRKATSGSARRRTAHRHHRTAGGIRLLRCAPTISEDQVRMVETVTHQPTAEPVEASSTFFSTGGGTATKTARPPIMLDRPYRPKQRASLDGTRGGRADRPCRVEGRPHRTPPVPVLGRIPVDGERGRRRRTVEGRGQRLTDGAAAVPGLPALPGEPGQPGHQHLEHRLARQHGGAPQVQIGIGQELDRPGRCEPRPAAGPGPGLLGRERAASAQDLSRLLGRGHLGAVQPEDLPEVAVEEGHHHQGMGVARHQHAMEHRQGLGGLARRRWRR